MKADMEMETTATLEALGVVKVARAKAYYTATHCRCCLLTLPCASVCSRIITRTEAFGRAQLLAEGGVELLLLHGPGRPRPRRHTTGEIVSRSGRSCVHVWAPADPSLQSRPAATTLGQNASDRRRAAAVQSSSESAGHHQSRGQCTATRLQITPRGLLKAPTVQTPPPQSPEQSRQSRQLRTRQ